MRKRRPETRRQGRKPCWCPSRRRAGRRPAANRHFAADGRLCYPCATLVLWLQFFRGTNSDPPALEPFIVVRDSAGKAGWASNRTASAREMPKPQQRASDGVALGETPSTKPQAPEKFQISNTQPKTDAGANGAQVGF